MKLMTRSVMSRHIHLAATALVGALLASCASVEMPASAQIGECASQARCSAKPGDLIEVSLRELHPTQPSLGYDEVYYKLGRYKLGKDAVNKRFDDWCEANGQSGAESAQAGASLKNPDSFSCKIKVGAETEASIESMKTAVIGPRGTLFLTDGHHTFTSFMEHADGGPDLKVRVRVQGNLSKLSNADFWREMEKNGWTWLRDVNDKPIMPEQLPQKLGLKNFQNDPYRGVLYFGRDIGYSQLKDNATFLEFYWGRWFRTHPSVKIEDYDLSNLDAYMALLRKLTEAQVALDDGGIVSNGKTAGELGKLAAWNRGKAESSGEFGKMKKPYSDAKPGKIAYALEYKKSLP
ncbi:MAG: hypothetical protein RL404_1235 [Pseudomonadota bacterium]